MSKRLGFKTDHVMLNLERKMNEAMNADPDINKSALVNGLLRKWFEGKLCPKCYGGVIRVGKCEKCDAIMITCRNKGCEIQTKTCECSWEEADGLPPAPVKPVEPTQWIGDR